MRVSSFLLAFILFLTSAATAQAGQLFPPENIGSNPGVPCPNGTVLSWSGNSVVCQDPTTGVNLSCPTGQILSGVSYGAPVCTTPASVAMNLSCPTGQVMTGISNGSPVCVTSGAGGAGLTATCPAGQVLTGVSGGSPVCKTFTCRQVYGTGGSVGPNYISIAACAAGEIMTGGGAVSETPGAALCGTSQSFLHASRPLSATSWYSDAFSYNWAHDACSLSVAICCKFQ